MREWKLLLKEHGEELYEIMMEDDIKPQFNLPENKDEFISGLAQLNLDPMKRRYWTIFDKGNIVGVVFIKKYPEAYRRLNPYTSEDLDKMDFSEQGMELLNQQELQKAPYCVSIAIGKQYRQAGIGKDTVEWLTDTLAQEGESDLYFTVENNNLASTKLIDSLGGIIFEDVALLQCKVYRYKIKE